MDKSCSREDPVTAPLVKKVMALRWQEGSPDLQLLIKQCVLDWIGVSIAAASEPDIKKLREVLEAQGGHPQASVFGSTKRMPTQQAALLNGTISHMLDYDDVNNAMIGHPTAPILPAVLALAEHRGFSGSELMDAFLTGYETACRIGLLVAPRHYEQGFHATATIGTFGSAAACARLLNLDESAAAHALSIAATRAAGLKAMFGTACKPLHAGLAATNGLFAAELAQRGFDSREDGLECQQGFADTHSLDFNREAALRDPEEGYHLYNNLFKFHAACYLLQPTIECGHKIRVSHNLAPMKIRTVRVRANTNCNTVCNIAEPRTGLEMKFSFRAAAALSLSGLETSRPDVFSDVNANSPSLNALRDRVTVELTSDLAIMQSEMEVFTSDEQTFRASHDAGIPSQDRIAQGNRILEKFHALADPVLGRDRSERIAAQVARLEHLKDVGDLMQLCV